MKNIIPFKGSYPKIGKNCYIAPNAYIIGDVKIGDNCAIMFGAIIRGDVNYIRIGNNTNVQDNAVLHVTRDKYPLIIGNNVSIGHGAIVHGCVIEDNVLIGIGAKVLDGAKIGENCIIAAGAVVRENSEFPSNSLVTGIPGKIKKTLNEKDIERIIFSAESYKITREDYLNEL